LVALARAEALDLVGQLPLDFICPPEVHAELDQGGRRRPGCPAAKSEQGLALSWRFEHVLTQLHPARAW
jgi:hypothetical protein